MHLWLGKVCLVPGAMSLSVGPPPSQPALLSRCLRVVGQFQAWETIQKNEHF